MSFQRVSSLLLAKGQLKGRLRFGFLVYQVNHYGALLSATRNLVSVKSYQVAAMLFSNTNRRERSTSSARAGMWVLITTPGVRRRQAIQIVTMPERERGGQESRERGAGGSPEILRLSPEGSPGEAGDVKRTRSAASRAADA